VDNGGVDTIVMAAAVVIAVAAAALTVVPCLWVCGNRASDSIVTSAAVVTPLSGYGASAARNPNPGPGISKGGFVAAAASKLGRFVDAVVRGGFIAAIFPLILHLLLQSNCSLQGSGLPGSLFLQILDCLCCIY
jgi:hypothetical protein